VPSHHLAHYIFRPFVFFLSFPFVVFIFIFIFHIYFLITTHLFISLAIPTSIDIPFLPWRLEETTNNETATYDHTPVFHTKFFRLATKLTRPMRNLIHWFIK
jgi:hypothetical protein